MTEPPHSFSGTGNAIPAVGHMPFPGHRKVSQIWRAQASAKKREHLLTRRAMEFGFDPESLKAANG